MFWALLRLILARATGLKYEFESGPKHIYAQEHKLYCYNISEFNRKYSQIRLLTKLTAGSDVHPSSQTFRLMRAYKCR